MIIVSILLPEIERIIIIQWLGFWLQGGLGVKGIDFRMYGYFESKFKKIREAVYLERRGN